MASKKKQKNTDLKTRLSAPVLFRWLIAAIFIIIFIVLFINGSKVHKETGIDDEDISVINLRR